jgi:hypothetical protein
MNQRLKELEESLIGRDEEQIKRQIKEKANEWKDMVRDLAVVQTGILEQETQLQEEV